MTILTMDWATYVKLYEPWYEQTIKNQTQHKEQGEVEIQMCEMTETRKAGLRIGNACDKLKELLIAKNQNYGNAALTPPPLADVSTKTAILVRLGDKFKRLQQLTHGEQDKVGESLKDTIQDIAGYCILFLICGDEKEAECQQ